MGKKLLIILLVVLVIGAGIFLFNKTDKKHIGVEESINGKITVNVDVDNMVARFTNKTNTNYVFGYMITFFDSENKEIGHTGVVSFNQRIFGVDAQATVEEPMNIKDSTGNNVEIEKSMISYYKIELYNFGDSKSIEGKIF